jgi:cytoskeletal protein CcmA (bactofilin family)
MLVNSTWRAWTVAIALGLTLMAPASAGAMTVRQGDSAGVPKGEVLADDLYAFGNTITVDGTVDGDVVAFGQVVIVNGDVRGSVITAAQTVRIDGTVGGTVRAAGSTVDIGGRVDGDVVAGANQVSITGQVKRDVAAGAQRVSITDSVGRNVMTGSESLSITGKVGGNVSAQSSRVSVAKDGSVAGNLEYWSAEQASVQGRVSGQTTRHEPQAKAQAGPTGAAGMASAALGVVVAWVESLLGFLLLGLLMVFVFRHPTEGGSQVVLNSAWSSLGAGALVFFTTPMALIFVFVVGLFFGAWWLAFVMMAAFWLLLLAGLIVGGLAVGRAILRRTSAAEEPSLTISLLLGLALVWLVGAIPFLGALVGWVVMLVGTGALVLLWMGKGQPPAARSAVETPGF